jgi:hypothetical protein
MPSAATGGLDLFVESYRDGELLEVREGDTILQMDRLDGSGPARYLIRKEVFDLVLVPPQPPRHWL